MAVSPRQVFGRRSEHEAAQSVGGLQRFGSEVKAEASRLLGHGAHELASALFNGHGFVLYGRGGREDGLSRQATPQVQQEMEMER